MKKTVTLLEKRMHMKNLILFLLFLGACSTDPREAAIIAHVETDANGVRYDLKTKITALEELTPVTARDSAEVLRAELHRQDSISRDMERYVKRVGLSINYEEPRQLVELREVTERQLAVYDANPDSVLLRRYSVTVVQKKPVEKMWTREYWFRGNKVVK